METSNSKKNANLTLKDIILGFKSYLSFLRFRWLIFLICGLLGGAIGFVYALKKKPVFIATCSFVLDNTKASSLSQYAGLASIAGINLNNDGGSVFEGDNITELYTSRTMIVKTLLSKTRIGDKQELLIDRYISFLQLRKDWQKDLSIGLINFDKPISQFSRKQDSLLIDITEAINKKVLIVDRPDKKLSIINVNVAFGDEVFAKAFNDSLVSNVNNFYIKTKTKKTALNVMILQKQADSVKAILNHTISGIASSLDSAPNPNPQQLMLKVPSQKKQVDLQSSSEIYGEIIKNLELARINLLQETPLIQVIDSPMLPLTVDKPKKIKSIVIGLFAGMLLSVFFVSTKKAYQNVMN